MQIKPIRMKTVHLATASGQKLQAQDITVTRHEVSHHGSGIDGIIVSTSPKQPGGSPIAVLSELGGQAAKTLASEFMQWQFCPDLLYSIAGMESLPGLISVVSSMVQSHAFPESEKWFVTAQQDTSASNVLLKLRSLELVQCVDPVAGCVRWQLTVLGMKQIQHWKRAAVSLPVFALRSDIFDRIIGIPDSV